MPEEKTNIFSNFFSTEISGELISSLIVIFIIMVLSLIVGILAARHNPLKKPKGLLLVAECGVRFFDCPHICILLSSAAENGSIL